MNSLGKYEVLRKYLINDTTIKNLLTVTVNSKDIVCIFTAEKPEKITANNYVILKMKELSGGYITADQVEFDIIGKDISKLLSVKDKIIELLDDPRNTKTIKDENVTILTSELVNGGGIAKNAETNNFNVIIYFKIQTKGVC
ncbi:hypothetical protein [Caproiciproducens sp. CPB-2]|uniref:hypothetical protein n=1 Tax=Caproiciproducens sp. CPB-2 TaxID=3030017 RepID=UPI0023DB79B5|nr:hypothetical protein [Caproiciproducens sp. CPB-2]MDF1496339.1 hypothetical protein [Caproiciproducens sp. CPB-2]